MTTNSNGRPFPPEPSDALSAQLNMVHAMLAEARRTAEFDKNADAECCIGEMQNALSEYGFGLTLRSAMNGARSR